MLAAETTVTTPTTAKSQLATTSTATGRTAALKPRLTVGALATTAAGANTASFTSAQVQTCIGCP